METSFKGIYCSYIASNAHKKIILCLTASQRISRAEGIYRILCTSRILHIVLKVLQVGHRKKRSAGVCCINLMIFFSGAHINRLEHLLNKKIGLLMICGLEPVLHCSFSANVVERLCTSHSFVLIGSTESFCHIKQKRAVTFQYQISYQYEGLQASDENMCGEIG